MAIDLRRPIQMPAALPAPRVLALGLLVLLLGLIWMAVVAPLLTLHAERAEAIAQQRRLAQRMEALIATLPSLRAEAARGAATPMVLLDGASDALAGAALQQQVQGLAERAGAGLASLEILPPEAVAGYRRISLRVVAQAGWPQLVALLREMRTARPDLVVDGLAMRSALPPGTRSAAPEGAPIEASFTVRAFRRETEAAPRAAPGSR